MVLDRACLNYFGDVQVVHICFHCSSGLNFSAHQHVWQYRDSALAWRRLKPSVLLSVRKDETVLARTRITQGSLADEHDLGGNFALCAYAEIYKTVECSGQSNLWLETEYNLVVARG